MKKTLKVVMLIAMLAVVLLSMTACGKTKLDITEGLTVVFDGADGSGRAEVEFIGSDDDMPPYMDKVLESKNFDATDWSDWMAINDAITYEIEPSSGLSNGDKVTVSINVNEAILENMGFSAKDSEQTFVVEGLAEVIIIDAFENFEITFTGISPSVYAEFAQNQVINDFGVFYKIEEETPYRDGDTLTVRASIVDNEYYKLKEETMQVTVSGVERYISSGEEILPETMQAMRDKADMLMADRFAVGAPTDYWQFGGYEYAGYVFMTLEEGRTARQANKCYLVYTVNVNADGTPFTSTYYFEFNNILQHLDGTQDVDVEDYGRPSFNSNYDLSNYQTIDARCEEIERVWGGGYITERYF